MRRAARERARTLRVWRAHIRVVHGGDIPRCACERQPGRFRKGQRVGDCGRPRCRLCKAGKLLGRPRPRQRRADLALHEWRRELGLPTGRPRGRW